MGMHHSSTVLAAVLLLCITSIIISYFNRPPESPPAIVFHALTIPRPTIAEGAPLRIEYVYDLRDQCPSGHYRFSALVRVKDGLPKDFYAFPWGQTIDDPPGVGMRAERDVKTVGLPPGSYTLELIARIRCKGETRDQIISSPYTADFDVVGSTVTSPWN